MSADFNVVNASDARKSPVRVAFVTRRVSAQVKVRDEEQVMTHPETFFRVGIAVELLAIALTSVALLWDAPLEQLADPMHTPNPAKAPWYFLGLQELLHYFPPVVAGVLIPTLVILALIVIPYFPVNVQGRGIWLEDKARRVRIAAALIAAFCVFLIFFDVWVALLPTLIVAAFFFLAAWWAPNPAGRFAQWLVAKPISFWIMTWFLCELAVLTAVGTFFRGPGWAWTWPWRQTW
jgi:hypothetical protein